MSPEQALGGALDARTDVYAMGLGLLEVLTGERRFENVVDPVQMIRDARTWTPRVPSKQNPEIPAEVDGVILKALQKDREQRYGDAEEMARDLKAALPRLRGPSDVGAFARGLAAERPDLLPQPERVEPEAPLPRTEVEKPRAPRPLTIVNLDVPSRGPEAGLEPVLPAVPIQTSSEPVAFPSVLFSSIERMLVPVSPAAAATSA